MSFEGGSNAGMNNPIGGMEQPKSKKKLWIFGGLGCLFLIGILCVGGAATFWFTIGKSTLDFINENMAVVENSPVAQDALGTPITLGTPSQENDGSGSVTFRTPASGPEASGTFVFKGALGSDGWTREEIYLEIDGTKIDLSDVDDIFNVQIDEGQ